MSVERKTQKSKKPLIITLCVAILIAAVGGVGFAMRDTISGWFSKEPSDAGEKHDATVEEATKVMLASNVSYDGTWYDDTDFGYHVYLPLTSVSSDKDYASKVVYVNEGGTAMSGITIGDGTYPTLEGDATADSNTMLRSVMDKITHDAGLNFFNATFSGAYELSSDALPNNIKALKVTGNLMTTLTLKLEGTDTPFKQDATYFLDGYIVLLDDTPVFFWGISDRDDPSVTPAMSSWVKECATTFWKTAT